MICQLKVGIFISEFQKGMAQTLLDDNLNMKIGQSAKVNLKVTLNDDSEDLRNE